jgi:hypothetical protein
MKENSKGKTIKISEKKNREEPQTSRIKKINRFRIPIIPHT